jgi:Protein of unknown function (DUF3306)
MATESEDPGFLARWSRRKVQVREGTPVAGPPLPATAPAPSAELHAVQPLQVDELPPADPPPPPPTLADVAELTRDSDFSRFVARGVLPDVKNAALKKLFTDPHFNIMDGLDTYIDDYGIPDPLPEGMLRKMTQAKFLGLFTDEDEPTAATQALPAPVADAEPLPGPSAEITPETAPDEDTDLRLQPHDDPGHAGPAPGAGQDAGREH